MSAKILFDRNYQDRYNDPGRFVTTKGKFAEDVLALDNNNGFLLGDGFSKAGQFPFLDEINLTENTTKRIYQSAFSDKYEQINDYDFLKKQLRVRIESKSEYPNYYVRDLGIKKTLEQLTFFENPFKALKNVNKELISYKRKDDLELSGIMYTPQGYNPKESSPLPMILWAYPREYKDKTSASQKTNNPNRFLYPSWGSPIYWATQGYVVLDRAAFPIIGEGDKEPNDSFRSQLVANAEAAINALVNKGFADRDRVAVGGHSYGAFMVANLLSHSNLFAAGIAREWGLQQDFNSIWFSKRIKIILGSSTSVLHNVSIHACRKNENTITFSSRSSR